MEGSEVAETDRDGRHDPAAERSGQPPIPPPPAPSSSSGRRGWVTRPGLVVGIAPGAATIAATCGSGVVRAFGREDVTPWVVMEDVDLSPEQTFRLPLLMVELVTNVLKHSLPDQNGGVIWVELRQRRDAIELTVGDSRIAPGPMFAPSPIVHALAQGLNGEAFVKDACSTWVAGALIPSDRAPIQVLQAPGGGFRSAAL